MDFEDFKEKFVEDVKESLYGRGAEDVNISTTKVDKLNESYDAMTVTPVGSNIGVNLSIDRFYEAMDHGVSYDEVVNRATNTVMDALENTPAVDVATLTDYELMKDKLVMEVVSAETNADMLAKIPHKDIEDMAVVYRFVINSDESGRASVLVTNQMLETMGVTPEQLHADALENSPELKPPVIKGMTEVLAEMMGMTQDDLAQMGMAPGGDEQMFVATVPDKVHGAGIIAYEGFMDQASERIGGGDFYILPSSLHEILIVPDNGQMSLKDLEAMVREVNATQVAPEDKLTDNVYHYDSQDKVFELGEKFIERQAAKETGIEGREEKGSVLGELKAKKDEVAKANPAKDTIEKGTKAKGGDAL